MSQDVCSACCLLASLRLRTRLKRRIPACDGVAYTLCYYCVCFASMDEWFKQSTLAVAAASPALAVTLPMDSFVDANAQMEQRQLRVRPRGERARCRRQYRELTCRCHCHSSSSCPSPTCPSPSRWSSLKLALDDDDISKSHSILKFVCPPFDPTLSPPRRGRTVILEPPRLGHPFPC